jgi:hypothetical protein
VALFLAIARNTLFILQQVDSRLNPVILSKRYAKYLERGSGNRTHHGPREPRDSGFADQEERQLHYPSDADEKIEFRKQLDADERRFLQIGQEYNKDSVFKKNAFDL